MRAWEALPPEEIEGRVFDALRRNRSYRTDRVLGLPGSFLDRQVFPALPQLDGLPLLAAMIDNPNHIGCHTLGRSEPSFAGTQALEQEVISICAEGLLSAEPETVDGYVASGGTESNIQALWTFRNALHAEGVASERIAVITSVDAHYSMHKAADLLGLALLLVEVNDTTRRMERASVDRAIQGARDRGIDHLLVVLTMGTTLFGSVDRTDDLLPQLKRAGMRALVHIDAAFGGFIYPLTHGTALDFRDPQILSITLDAHKMLQAPYGTGIHLIRKGWIQHALTPGASYVPGLDCTLAGSRSGTNAVAVWMILRSYGSAGGRAFCNELIARTDLLCEGLDALGLPYYRHAGMNLVTLRAEGVPAELAARYQLVPDDFARPRWWKIVIMDHVTTERVLDFLQDARTLCNPSTVNV